LWCISIIAQVPESFTYQAIVRDASGNPYENLAVVFQIRILQGSTSGSEVYKEEHITSTNKFGLVNLIIGNGTNKTGNFATIDWGANIYFMNVKIDIGDAIFTDMGTTQLLSVPYAMHAKTITSFSYNDLTDRPGFIKWDKDSTDNVILTGNQTINGNKTFTGTTTVPAPVNATDAVTKTYVDALLTKIEELESQPGIVKDYDGNLYTTLKIGDQIWMGENLKTTRYANGDLIGTTDPYNKDISSETDPEYQWAYNGNESNIATYGRLYTWYAVTDNRNVCPASWHSPSDAEWTILATYLGGVSVAGGKLKENGTLHWISPNTGATNETGFTALPGGYRTASGTFSKIGEYAMWWSVTVSDDLAWARYLLYNNNSVIVGDDNKKYGYSIRCIKD
jgi:uncharacterized protein (TIGR02145 family)